MIDFTSSLYLGMLHPTPALTPWRQLTTGAPAVLRSPPVGARVGREVARIQQCERAEVRRSTLHAFWDVFGALTPDSSVVLVDGGSYPVVGWGVERAQGRGVKAHRFAHHDPDDLRRQLNACRRTIPVVVCDGFCPGCGGPAPLAAYHELVRDHGGLLVLDDTQALGILGRRPRRVAPYGERGGGTLAWAGVGGSDVVAVSSLAKAFGAPVAVVAGSSDVLGRLASRSETIVYSSAPSFADLHAAERALAVNRTTGDRLRRHLATLVRRLRRRVGEQGLSLVGGSFPVQAFATADLDGAWAIHRTLLGKGVRTVVQRPRCRRGAYVTLIVTARHRLCEIDRAAAALAQAVPGKRSRVTASSSPQSSVTTSG